MSGSDDEEISNVDRRGYREGGSDGDDDNDDDGDDDAAIGKKQSRRMGIGKAKQVVLHQFTKAKRQIRRIRSKRTLLPSSSSSSSSSSGNASITGSGKMTESVGTRTGIGCKFCFSRPKVLESPNGSPISDPNDPNFTNAMLRTLIENNSFYSKECNPHLD